MLISPTRIFSTPRVLHVCSLYCGYVLSYVSTTDSYPDSQVVVCITGQIGNLIRQRLQSYQRSLRVVGAVALGL